MTTQEQEQLENVFTYHPPKPEQIEKYHVIRERGRTLAATLLETCPPSRERSLALTKIEEACFWANASVARNT